jgi:hypothetical protein
VVIIPPEHDFSDLMKKEEFVYIKEDHVTEELQMLS